MGKTPIALQMYTLREEAGRDFAGTLKRVAALGYAGVEFAGTYGMSATDLKALIEDLGLQAAGSHAGLDQLENSLDAVIDYHLTLGVRHLICPWLPPERRGDGEGYRRLGEKLTEIGQVCRGRGLQLCYHHHDFEFQQFGGKAGLDILFEASDPSLVKAELDTYWIAAGGSDPAEYIRKYSGRAPLIHLKDMANDAKRSFAEVGTGTLDFAAIFAACEAGGAEWYIVEQDVCARPPLESVEISLKNLRAWGKE